MTETAPKRKRRFQFSLRTLMLAVLIYGGLWLLTIKWGANQIVNEFRGSVSSKAVRWTLRGNGAFSYEVAKPNVLIEGKTYSPIPFVIFEEIVINYDSNRVSVPNEPAVRYVFLWFFGAHKRIYEMDNTPLN